MPPLVKKTNFACVDTGTAIADGRPTGPPSAGLLADQKPYQPALQFIDPTAIEVALDLDNARGHPLEREARRALLANVACRAWTEPAPCSIFYARDRNAYVGLRRYMPRHHRLRHVIAAVDALEVAGLVTHARTRPSRAARLRSSIYPTDRLLQALEPMKRPGTICFMPPERIVLRGENRRPLPYRDTAETVAMRADVHEQNRFLSACAITIEHPDAALDAAGFIVIAGRQRLDPTRRSARRIFNRDFAHGGRWYGPWWQSVPARLRPFIHIDGTPTIEHDFRCCHPRLLHALAGLPAPVGDPYQLGDLPRDEVKLAVNIMLNAHNTFRARGAISKKLEPTYAGDAPRRARELMKAVRLQHPRLKGYWNSGIGLRLLSIDADICAQIQCRLRGCGVPVLSVHDSFLVPTSHGDLLQQVMEETFEAACRRLRNGEKSLTIWG